MDHGDAPAGRLVVCATPIGNLQDVTLRVLDALRDADLVACEDTRRSQVLLERHGIRARALLSCHEHNERERVGELVARMLAGETVALISDAGMPLVSDPGYPLVGACVAAGVAVEVLPGPSAVMSALVLADLPVGRWCFVGFLPRKRAEVARLLDGARETLLAFESPQRIAGTLAVLAESDPERPVAVCRELTKLHEEVRRGSARELAAHYAEHPPRGEIVLVVGAAPARRGDIEQGVAELRALVRAGARARPAAGVVARLTGLAANELYRALTAESEHAEPEQAEREQAEPEQAEPERADPEQ
jgi:16S rRNA (cytidine1402-2'-O)-methyltransferase